MLETCGDAACNVGADNSAGSLLSRNELEQILWHCDTGAKAGETPKLHSVLVDSKVKILEERNKTLKHELERTQILEQKARQKLAEALGTPYSVSGVFKRSSKKDEDV